MSWKCPYCWRICGAGAKSVSVDGIHARLTCGRFRCLRVAAHARRACREQLEYLKAADRLKEPGPGHRLAMMGPTFGVAPW